jgi:hypothetical protein
VTGYVFDQTAHKLRPILGLPGASLFGNPIDFGFDVAAAYVAPRQDAAFLQAVDGTLHVLRLSSGASSERSVDNLMGSPERVAFSPSGTSAALYAGGSIEVVKGLPDNPSVSGGIDLASGAQLDSMAISDDGALMLVSTGNSVRLYGSLADMGELMTTNGHAQLAFAAGGHDAAIADPSGAGIVLYRDLTGARESRVLAASDDTIGKASALAFSADGRNLLMASADAASLTTFDLAGGARNAVACSCQPSRLTRMGDVFRLNDLGGDPVWLLDTRSSEPRLVFVPALAAQ